PAPAREDKRSLPFITAQILEMKMVQPPQRIETGYFRLLTLLPIHPPEIDTLPVLTPGPSPRFVFAIAPLSASGRGGFERMMKDFKVAFHEARVGNVEGNWLFGRGIDPHPLCHALI